MNDLDELEFKFRGDHSPKHKRRDPRVRTTFPGKPPFQFLPKWQQQLRNRKPAPITLAGQKDQ